MANSHILFGPAGNSDSFYAQGHKHSEEMPEWLLGLGLNAYEYSFGRGINLGEQKAAAIGTQAKSCGIAVSVHAPYYINLANENPESRAKSRQYLYSSAAMAKVMGAGRIVFHPGACTGRDRAMAMETALHELDAVLCGMKEQGLDGVLLCPETMGKPKQLGTVEEVLQMCAIGPGLLPAIDFGHINALEQGSLKTKSDFERIIDRIEADLGQETARCMHIHYSHIEYGASGEVRHLTLDDDTFGPDFLPLAQVLCDRKMRPTVICESRKVMAEDALSLKRVYETVCGELLK